MRILIVSQYFWPENFPINSLAISLCDAGHSVDVLTGKPNYPNGKVFKGYKRFGITREEFHGCSVYRAPLRPRGKGATGLALNFLSFVVSGSFFAPWLLRSKQYDAIFVYGVSPILQAIPALIIGRIKRAPVAIWVQDLWPLSLSATGYVTNKSVLRVVERLVSYIYRLSNLLLVQSPSFVEPVTRLSGNTPVIYHPNSAPSIFLERKTEHDSTLPNLPDGFCVMFAGNVGLAQAPQVIIDAAEYLKNSAPHIKFIMVGDGRLLSWMQEIAHSKELHNIVFLGQFPLEQASQMLQIADALLVTLADQRPYNLTIPSKIQAYLAAGKPIVASLNGIGAQTITHAQAGLAVPAEDGLALSKAIVSLSELNVNELAAMGANGHEYYMSEFDSKLRNHNLIQFFQEMGA